MNRQDLGSLLLLAALWGGSFMFARVAAPEWGPLPTAAMRVAVAALVLMPWALSGGHWPAIRRHWKPLFLVGVFNSALPFFFFAFAALHITAGLSAMFNAATPLFGALIAWVWLGDRLTRWRVLGLAIGFVGVSGLAYEKAGLRAGAEGHEVLWAILACTAAAALYGVAASMTKKYLHNVAPMAVSFGSMVASTLALMPVALCWWPAQTPSLPAIGAVIAIGVLCTGLAYVIFFRLVARVGPANAMTVTFLIPVFAALWGWLFLNEPVTQAMWIGGGVILLGTALATGWMNPGHWTTGRGRGR